MEAEKKFRFVVGPQVTGEAFFGRRKELEELKHLIFQDVGAVSLIGPTRIGKSSLVSRVFEENRDCPGRLGVQFSMANCADAFDFWYTFRELLRPQIVEAGIWNAFFERKYEELDGLDAKKSSWYMKMKLPLRFLLEEIGKAGCRVVLAIDEFDAVERVFGDNAEYFQLLRSVFSEPSWSTSGVIISRRRLQMFEAECPYISTFHGVFSELPLCAFSGEDMEEYYEKLDGCGVRLTEEGKRRLDYYTGRMPYFCSMFGERMAAEAGDACLGPDEVAAVFRGCLPQVDRHYDDLIRRVEEDGQLELLFYLSIDAGLPAAARRHCENMRMMGVLNYEEKDGNGHYYAFSEDFMAYFRLKPLELPAWETMMAGEKRLKKMFARVYPELETTGYREFTGDDGLSVRAAIDHKYPELRLDWKQVERYCETLSAHKDNPSVLDVLTLPKVIGVMLYMWDSRFCHFFLGDSGFKAKLKLISKLRNPMAHAQLEHIGEEELAACMQYCGEIIRMDG